MNISLPAEVSYQKEPLPGCYAYVFRHKELGEIGRIVVQGLPNGHCHLASEVPGILKIQQQISEKLYSCL